MEKSKAKGGRVCCVVNCKNTTKNAPPGTQFYRFPVSKHKIQRRKEWIATVRRENPDGSPWQPTNNTRICSEHFLGNKKSEHPLHPSYNPTIFPSIYQKHVVSPNLALQRFERSMRRTKVEAPQATCSKMDEEKNCIQLTEELIECSINKSVNVHVVEKVDASTQVDFLEEVQTDYVLLVYVRHNNIETCDAEVQTSIPLPKEKVKIIRDQLELEERIVDEKKMKFVDKKVGPETSPHNGFYGVSSISSDQQMLDLAGVTLETFKFLLDTLPKSQRGKVSQENRLLIFLMKMKCGLTFSALSVLFDVHRTTVARIFYYTLQYLVEVCRNYVFWPEKEDVQATMPEVFKENYRDCRVIIDCTEIKVEEPPTVEDRVQFYSHYKKGFTIKVLVGCTPSGCISFLSRCMGGRTSDAQITCKSGLLELLEPGDVVLADKGFPQIKTMLDESGRGILLVMPPFLTEPHFSEEQVNETYKVAKVRIHIERIMSRIRIYRILSKLSVSMFPHCDDILLMCCVLVNLQPPILKDSDSDKFEDVTDPLL